MFKRFTLLLSPLQLRSQKTAKSAFQGFSGPLALFLALSALAGCYWGGHFLFTQILKTGLIADLFIQKTLGFVFQVFSWILFFSTLITSFSTHYLSQDLPLLFHSPVDIKALFAARSAEAWANTSWMVFLFAYPTLMPLGALLDAHWSFYFILALALFLLTLFMTLLACSFVMIIARFLPAKRTQEYLIFFLVIAFIYIYTHYASARPGRFFEQDGFKDLMSMLSSLNEVGQQQGLIGWLTQIVSATLPSALSTLDLNDVEMLQISPEDITPLRPFWMPLLGLFSSLFILITLALSLAHFLYQSGFWLAQEGVGQSSTGLQGLKRFIRPPRYAKSMIQAFANKEKALFWRTPSQWTQLLLVGSLTVVYLYNFKYLNTLKNTGFFSLTLLYVVHLTLSSLMMITLAARFLYPSVSMEGKALWALRSAPISTYAFLKSKVSWWFYPIIFLSMSISGLGGWMSNLSWMWMILALSSSAFLAIGIMGLAVGMGAMFPQFNLPNPMTAVAGLGGILFMLLALVYLAGLMLISIPLTKSIDLLQNGFTFHSLWVDSSSGLLALCSLFGILLWTGGTYFGSLFLGARQLEKKWLEGA